MGNTCLNCKKPLGFLSGENQIHANSEHFICDKCYSPFGSAANRIKALRNPVEIRGAYNDALNAVHQSALIEKELILHELEEACRSRLLEIDLNEREIIRLEKKDEEEKEKKKKVNA